jgi:hypothetical protein
MSCIYCVVIPVTFHFIIPTVFHCSSGNMHSHGLLKRMHLLLSENQRNGSSLSCKSSFFFPPSTGDSNLLHARQVLYHLGYDFSPFIIVSISLYCVLSGRCGFWLMRRKHCNRKEGKDIWWSSIEKKIFFSYTLQRDLGNIVWWFHWNLMCTTCNSPEGKNAAETALKAEGIKWL